jgi:FkbM family methyltransferase
MRRLFDGLRHLINDNYRGDLIYDVGMHTGQDTDFYLAKGFRVVAIEANPTLASAARLRFAEPIQRGRLTIINVGIAKERGARAFYINETISEWSSFDHSIASRGHPVKTVNIETCQINDIIRLHGVPYYAKVDIEGFDHIAMYDFISQKKTPYFVSHENPSPDLFEALVRSGYSRFKVISQAKVPEYKCPKPAREGRTVDYVFPFGSSGPFGEDTTGDWIDVKTMRERVGVFEQTQAANPGDWFDLHAAL